MDHSLLPSIRSASLPVKYQAAKVALAECNLIDECKDWADKTMALASYAKQANDKELEITAMRIRARAIRRCGELLLEVEKAQGKRTDLELKRGTSPKLSRKDAAERAGMSPDQQKDAIRVARVNGESFEEQIESDDPPTIEALADQGKAERVPYHVQRGITIEVYQAGMYFRARLRDLVERTKEFDPQDVIDGSDGEERDEIRSNVSQLMRYFDKLIIQI
jgi:hypothetical protein